MTEGTQASVYDQAARRTSLASSGVTTRNLCLLSWSCGKCKRDCLPIRSESRCLCGHRLKEHDPLDEKSPTCRCRNNSCECKHFTYIVAEGAWILRCQCKHKHTDHHPNTHACRKPGCKCACFHSPWTCNCNHPWSDHQQVLQVKPVMGLPSTTEEDLKMCAELGTGGVASEMFRVQRGVPSASTGSAQPHVL